MSSPLDQSQEPYSIRQAARDALETLEEVNVGVVVASMGRAMEAVEAERQRMKRGLDFSRYHPVTMMFVNRLEELSGSTQGVRFHHATMSCTQLARGTGDIVSLQWGCRKEIRPPQDKRPAALIPAPTLEILNREAENGQQRTTADVHREGQGAPEQKGADED